MRVLGLDPSLRSTGFGIVESRDGRYVPLAFGVIRPVPGRSLAERLNEIRTELRKLLADFGPAEVAIENPFLARNVRTTLVLGQVRGAVLTAVADAGAGLHEYSPAEIKKALTGYGRAEKDQVQAMVRTLLALEDGRIPADSADALAAAICHLNACSLRERLEEA